MDGDDSGRARRRDVERVAQCDQGFFPRYGIGVGRVRVEFGERPLEDVAAAEMLDDRVHFLLAGGVHRHRFAPGESRVEGGVFAADADKELGLRGVLSRREQHVERGQEHC